MRLVLVGLFLSLCLWASTGGAQSPQPDAGLQRGGFDSLRKDCDEECHSWLIENQARTILANVRLHFSEVLRIVTVPTGSKASIARLVGWKSLANRWAAFASVPGPAFQSGFCPRVSFEESTTTPYYLASYEWNKVVFDAERATPHQSSVRAIGCSLQSSGPSLRKNLVVGQMCIF